MLSKMHSNKKIKGTFIKTGGLIFLLPFEAYALSATTRCPSSLSSANKHLVIDRVDIILAQ